MFTCAITHFCVTKSEAIDTSFASFSPCYKKVEEKGKKRQIKGHGTVDEPSLE